MLERSGPNKAQTQSTSSDCKKKTFAIRLSVNYTHPTEWPPQCVLHVKRFKAFRSAPYVSVGDGQFVNHTWRLTDLEET